MAKVTSKLQLTLPKALAERYGVRPGDEVEWIAAGDSIRLAIPSRGTAELSTTEKLALFDRATQRLAAGTSCKTKASPQERGWKRSDLYERGEKK